MPLCDDYVRHICPKLLKPPYVCNGCPDRNRCRIEITIDPEIMVSDRTLYKYINNSLFSARNIYMPRTIRMRPRKNKNKVLKVDKECRKGRTYEDFLKSMEENPDSVVCEGDSVEAVRVDFTYSLFWKVNSTPVCYEKN